MAVGVPAFVLSAGNGIRAADVVSWSQRSLGFRCALWTGWLVLSGPGLRAVFVAPGALSLRALRVPRAPLLIALFGLCAVVESPWVVLFARGSGWAAGFAALTGSVTVGALAVSVWARPRRSTLAAIAFAALLIALGPPPALLALLSSLAVPWALHAALGAALEQPALHFKFTRPASPLTALYAVHVLRLLRSERSRLSAAFSAVATAAFGLVWSLRNDPSQRPLQRALIVMALPLTVVSAVGVGPLLESERRMKALLRSLRVRQSAIVAAFLLSIISPSSAFAAASGAVVSSVTPLGTGASCLGLLAWSAALGSLVALWGRCLERRAQRGTGIFFAGVTLIAVLATAGAYTW